MSLLKRSFVAVLLSIVSLGAPAQTIKSGHVLGNGTASERTPTDASLYSIMQQSGSGLGTGIAGALGANIGAVGAPLVAGQIGVSGQCAQYNSAGALIPAVCPGGGTGSGTVSEGSTGNIGYWSTGGTTIAPYVLGSGVLTALGVNIGSAGAPVLFNGAGGTPSSMILTNATGLPNAGLLNSSITLGTSSVALGGALTSVNGAIAWTGTPTFSNATYSALFTGGNVGFGTTSPIEPVHIFNNATGDDILLIDQTNQNSYSTILNFRRQSTAVWNVGVDFTNSNAFKIAAGGSNNNFSAGTFISITTAGVVDIPGSFINPSLPGLSASVESSGVPGLDMPGCTTAAACAWYIYGGPTLASGAAGSSTLNINRSPTGTGGSGALNPAAIYVTTSIPAGDSYFEWGITSLFENAATGTNGSQNVAIAGIANKVGTGIVGATFGGNISCQDQTGQATPTYGCVGLEVDTATINSSGTPVNGGTDPNKNRIALAVVMQGASGTHAGYGIAIGHDTAGDVFDCGICFNGVGSYGIGIDFTPVGAAYGTTAIMLGAAFQDGIAWKDTSGNFSSSGGQGFQIVAANNNNLFFDNYENTTDFFRFGSGAVSVLEIAYTGSVGTITMPNLPAGLSTTHLCLNTSQQVVTC